MNRNDALARELEDRILDWHARFTDAIRRRLPGMDVEQRKRYLLLVSTLVSKLERTELPLKQVLRESVGDLLPVVMQELAL
jgi:hypothetical protein